MAGSWRHAVEPETGKLLVNEEIVGMLENGGDWYEFAEEAYGMVWFLAYALQEAMVGPNPEVAKVKLIVEAARVNYKDGLEVSPGTDGHREEDEDD